MKRYSVACVSAIAMGLVSAISSNAGSVSCTVNLDQGTHNCGSIPEIEIKQLNKAINGSGTGQALIKITLDSAYNPSLYAEAVFRITYTQPYGTGWTVNIGDSSTNDGWKGDSGTQSNDAEMQIVNNSMAVYGNDYRPDITPLFSQSLLQGFNYTDIILRIKDRSFGWKQLVADRFGNMNSYGGEVRSQYLYALNNQEDTGLKNNDIYASFNRTIGNASRNGKGVGSVKIELKPAATVPVVTSATGEVWMDRNLGASRAATSSTDTNAYGNLYQWSNTLCPQGFRLPTYAELNKEKASWSSPDAVGAFASPLKLVTAGYLEVDGSIQDKDVAGLYWGSTVSGNQVGILYFLSDGVHTYMDSKANYGGLSVRCIQN